MRTGKLLESEDEEAIAPLPKIEDSDEEMKEEDRVNGTVTAEKVVKADENGEKTVETAEIGEKPENSGKDNSDTESDSKTRKKSKKSKKSKGKTDKPPKKRQQLRRRGHKTNESEPLEMA